MRNVTGSVEDKNNINHKLYIYIFKHLLKGQKHKILPENKKIRGYNNINTILNNIASMQLFAVYYFISGEKN